MISKRLLQPLHNLVYSDPAKIDEQVKSILLSIQQFAIKKKILLTFNDLNKLHTIFQKIIPEMNAYKELRSEFKISQNEDQDEMHTPILVNVALDILKRKILYYYPNLKLTAKNFINHFLYALGAAVDTIFCYPDPFFQIIALSSDEKGDEFGKKSRDKYLYLRASVMVNKLKKILVENDVIVSDDDIKNLIKYVKNILDILNLSRTIDSSLVSNAILKMQTYLNDHRLLSLDVAYAACYLVADNYTHISQDVKQKITDKCFDPNTLTQSLILLNQKLHIQKKEFYIQFFSRPFVKSATSQQSILPPAFCIA